MPSQVVATQHQQLVTAFQMVFQLVGSSFLRPALEVVKPNQMPEWLTQGLVTVTQMLPQLPTLVQAIVFQTWVMLNQMPGLVEVTPSQMLEIANQMRHLGAVMPIHQLVKPLQGQVTASQIEVKLHQKQPPEVARLIQMLIQVQVMPSQILAKLSLKQAQEVVMPSHRPVMPAQGEAMPSHRPVMPVLGQATPNQMQEKPLQMQEKPLQMQEKPLQMLLVELQVVEIQTLLLFGLEV